MRAIPEWVAKHDDQAIPPRVRLRIYGNGGCRKCHRQLRPGQWDCDHIIALANGGQHRESNLQALCSGCHTVKTKDDVAAKAKTARIRKRNAGIRKRRKTIPGHRFDGTAIPSKWVG